MQRRWPALQSRKRCRAGADSQTSSAVINGQLDTTHQAVVAIVLQSGSQGGLCSGTIVKTDPATHIGWVVAAAHCVDLPPVFVLQGDDFSQASGVLRYDVIDYKADSRYGGQVGSPYDFAVLRIAGVDATTPTIPLASASDGLAVGTNVLSVGYGRTTLIASGAGTENTVRRRVAKSLGQVGQMIAYDMASSGICQGDSGGPVLVGSPGVREGRGRPLVRARRLQRRRRERPRVVRAQVLRRTSSRRRCRPRTASSAGRSRTPATASARPPRGAASPTRSAAGTTSVSRAARRRRRASRSSRRPRGRSTPLRTASARRPARRSARARSSASTRRSAATSCLPARARPARNRRAATRRSPARPTAPATCA